MCNVYASIKSQQSAPSMLDMYPFGYIRQILNAYLGFLPQLKSVSIKILFIDKLKFPLIFEKIYFLISVLGLSGRKYVFCHPLHCDLSYGIFCLS